MRIGRNQGLYSGELYLRQIDETVIYPDRGIMKLGPSEEECLKSNESGKGDSGIIYPRQRLANC